MTLLKKNLETMQYLMYYHPDVFKGVTVSNDNLNYEGCSISLRDIDIKEIILSNENLKTDISKMTIDQVVDILKLHENLSQQSLKTNNADVYEHNNKVINNLKNTNELMKNISTVNRVRDMSSEQYFNIIDANGDVHIFKNDRGLDISKIYEEFIATNNEENLNQFISLMNRKLHQVGLVSAVNIEDKQSASEDNATTLNAVKEEFDGKLGVGVYGNEKEDMIVIVDKLNPENNEVRTYRRDEEMNLVTEKHTNDYETDKKDSKSEEREEIKEEKKPEKEEKPEEEIEELIPYNEFKELINLDVPLNEEQKKNIKLWEQTMGDIYVYEEYLPSDVLKFLDDYGKTMAELETNKQNGMINENQQEALTNYYDMTNPTFKDAKLGNLSEEKKNAAKLVQTLEMNNNDGKMIIAIILSVSLVTLAIIVAFLTYMLK